MCSSILWQSCYVFDLSLVEFSVHMFHYYQSRVSIQLTKCKDPLTTDFYQYSIICIPKCLSCNFPILHLIRHGTFRFLTFSFWGTIFFSLVDLILTIFTDTFLVVMVYYCVFPNPLCALYIKWQFVPQPLCIYNHC